MPNPFSTPVHTHVLVTVELVVAVSSDTWDEHAGMGQLLRESQQKAEQAIGRVLGGLPIVTYRLKHCDVTLRVAKDGAT